NHREFAGDDLKSLIRIGSDGNAVQPGNHPKPEVQNVKRNKEEENDSRDSLNQVEPIPWVRIRQIIRTSFEGYEQAIDSVVNKRYENPSNFHKQNVWNRLQVMDGKVKVSLTVRCIQRFRIGIKMFE